MYNPYQYAAYSQPNYINYMPQRQEVIRVNGRNGAEAYQMAPNSSILLLDETAPIIWLKTTDGASYPTITGYQISPLETKTVTSETDISSLEARIARLEELVNGKSDVTDVKPIKTIKQSA